MVMRTFKVTSVDGCKIGKYTGNTAKQAAQKAFASVFRKKNESINSMELHLKEIIDSDKVVMYPPGVYKFRCRREKLEKPLEFEIEDKDGSKKTVIAPYRMKITLINA